LPLPLLVAVAVAGCCVAAAAAAAATHCKCSPTARLSQDFVSATFGQHHYFHSSCLAWRVHKKTQKKIQKKYKKANKKRCMPALMLLLRCPDLKHFGQCDWAAAGIVAIACCRCADVAVAVTAAAPK